MTTIEFATRLEELRLSAPLLRFPESGKAIELSSAAEALHGMTFHGLPGTEASGVATRMEIACDGQGMDMLCAFSSSAPLRNVQFVQGLNLALDWRSYVIAPGAMYNGNRFMVSPQPYCPSIPTEGVSPDGPILMADLPRLCSDTGYRAEFAANELAISAIGILDVVRKTGFLIGFDVYGPWGVLGLNLSTLPGGPISVEICAPCVRRRRYRHCDWCKTEERGMDMEAGLSFLLRIRAIPIVADSIPLLVSRLASYGYETRGTGRRRATLPLMEAVELVEAKIDACNWDEACTYYRSSVRGEKWPLQSGWVGGGPTFFAMANSLDAQRRLRAIRMMDSICKNALSPSGYFHGLHDGLKWASFGVKRPGCRAFSLIRRPLECARDVLKTLELLRSQGERVDRMWECAAKSNLDAILRTAARFGHLGYTVDFETGDILWGESCCGVFGIEPLVRGAKWFACLSYLKAAKLLAERYSTRYLHRGFTCGGVGDALMAVDSESAYALLSGLVHLHVATGESQYLEWARMAADLFATWVLHYDAKLPPDSPLGKLGIQPRGAVFANIQNRHGAPGICTASGDSLLALHKLTGESRYLKLLEDIALCSPQMIVRQGQEEIWGGLPPGSVSERLMSFDGMEPCGHTAPLSTWAEIAMLLTAYELPACHTERYFEESIVGATI